MNTLESLVNKVIDRIRPICLENIDKSKKSSGQYALGIALLGVGIVTYWIFSDSAIKHDSFLMMMTIGFTFFTALSCLIGRFVKKEIYTTLLNMDASNYDTFSILDNYEGDIVLNDEETQELLSLNFSEKNLSILHDAISRGSSITFYQLAKMHEQQKKEESFVSNQAALINKGLYNKDKQQKNLQDLNAISAVKTNYKTFNSKNIL